MTAGWEGKRHYIVRRVRVGSRALPPSIFFSSCLHLNCNGLNVMPRDLSLVSQFSSRIKIDFNASILLVVVVISEKVQLRHCFP